MAGTRRPENRGGFFYGLRILGDDKPITIISQSKNNIGGLTDSNKASKSKVL
jgi:hypothetical protein